MQGLDARLTNRSLLVFDFQAINHERQSARKSKTKMVGKPAWHRILTHCPHFGTLGVNELIVGVTDQ